MADTFFKVEVSGDVQKRLEGSREVALIQLNKTLREIGSLLVPALRADTPVGASGDLNKKTVFQVLGRGEDQTLEIRQSAKSGQSYFYGQAVRGGTKPHFPPSRALEPWVRKKLGVPAPASFGVAFLIARKISQVGTRKNPYHLGVLKRMLPQIQAIVNKSGQALAARIAQG